MWTVPPKWPCKLQLCDPFSFLFLVLLQNKYLHISSGTTSMQIFFPNSTDFFFTYRENSYLDIFLLVGIMLKISKETSMEIVKIVKNISQWAIAKKFQETAYQKFSWSFKALEVFWIDQDMVALEIYSIGMYQSRSGQQSPNQRKLQKYWWTSVTLVSIYTTKHIFQEHELKRCFSAKN